MTKTDRQPAELRSMFGRNLKVLAKSYPSISELARRLGINRTQFNRYLSGESFPRPDVLDRICRFFGVDARVLLEPVENLAERAEILTGPFLKDFVGTGITGLTEETFPSGFYRFSRRSFTTADRFVVGLVHVRRRDDAVVLRGYESREAMAQQGLPTDAGTREFRGLVLRQEEGIAMLISRRRAMTASFNFVTRVPAIENNYWLGYLTRTVPEAAGTQRVARMVYEYLGPFSGKVLAAAREAGLHPAEDLLPFHRRLLQIDQPFA